MSIEELENTLKELLPYKPKNENFNKKRIADILENSYIRSLPRKKKKKYKKEKRIFIEF